MTYTLIDAINDEIMFLEQLKDYSDNNDSLLLSAIYRENMRSLQRIANRYDKGLEYYLGYQKGKATVCTRKTNKHLARQYPAVEKAKNNLDTVVNIVNKEK